MADAVKKLPRIVINERFCKGCNLCVDFCPTNVLEMRGPVVAVRNLEACTRCEICDQRCPDFAIQIFD